MKTAKHHRPEVKHLALALTLTCGLLLLAAPAAQAAVTVSNVSAAQTPGTKQVVVTYDLASTETFVVTVSILVNDGDIEEPRGHVSFSDSAEKGSDHTAPPPGGPPF